MNKKFKDLLNMFLKLRGLKIIRQYELEYYIYSYKKLIEEVNGFFKESIFPNLPKRSGRNELLSNLYGTGVCEALYIIYFLDKSIKLEGDICEFGIGNGATSTLLANEIKMTRKNIWLFDSFQGLSKPGKKDILLNDIFGFGEIGKYEGSMRYNAQEVKSRLARISFPRSRTKIISGFIQNALNKQDLPNKICFAYLDFDLYEPTSLALAFIDKHLVRGGFLVVDDYNYFSRGVKTAVDEFMSLHKSKYELSLPRKFAGYFCIIRKL